MEAIVIKTKPKRKRSVVADDTRISVITDTKRPKKDVPVSPFIYDDEAVDKTDAETHLNDFLDASSAIGEIIDKIYNLKSSKKEIRQDDVEKLKSEAAVKFITLKRLNRLSHVRSKKSRDSTLEAKEKMDGYHLQLQNLLYETAHLRKEITKCLQFKSKDEEIQLVPIEDFIKDAPEDISKLNETTNDEHKLKLARLDWELEQRKRLASKLKDVEKERDEINVEIKSKKEQLDSLQPKLVQILETTKPLQEDMDLPYDKLKEDHEKASHLPSQLYVLYKRTTAYSEACDKNVVVTICGDLHAAKNFKLILPEKEIDSDSDAEEAEKKTSKRRRKTVEERLTSAVDVVLRKHPLSIIVSISLADGTNLTLSFEYLVQLRIACVKATVNTPHGALDELSSYSGLLSGDTILHDLYPGDHGNTSPNPANVYDLSKLGSEGFSKYTSQVGHPYLWVQVMCGEQFLVDVPQASDDGARHTPETFRKIRHRLRCRTALLKQIVALEKRSVVVGKESQDLFPTKIVSELTGWTTSSYQDFQLLPHCQAYIESGVARETDFYFTATAARKSAKMTCEVVIRSDYPASPPLFVLSLDWKNKRTADNDFHIQNMESEVNMHWRELIAHSLRDRLLTNQVCRLLVCMDVYLESEQTTCEQNESVEMTREHVYPKLTRGPHRCKPYKYDSNLGLFTHR